MADPLSIASGAVGFVTLGLTACKSVVSFYETYRDQDEETNSLVRKSEELRVVLESIEYHLPQLQHSHQKLAESVAASIEELVKSLGSLDPAVAKNRKAKDPKDFKEKLRTVFSRAAYPLRRETILDLNRRVNDCRENLSFALTAVKMVRSDSAFTVLSAQLKDLQESMAKLQGSVDLVTSSPSQPGHTVAKSSLTIDQPPLEISSDSPAGTLVVLRQQNYTTRLCLCRPQRSGQKSVWQIGPCALFSHATRSSKHFPDCPYNIQWENTQRYGVEFMLSTWGRKHFVQAFLNWTTGGGFLLLSPGLRVGEVVSGSNPAFRVINSIVDPSCPSWIIDQFRVHERIDAARFSVKKSFQERQASPMVVNDYGWSLLMAAFFIISFRWDIYLKSPTAIQSFIDSFRNLVFALKEYGVSFTEGTESERTPGSFLLSSIMRSAYASGKDPSDHLFWTEMIKLIRELLMSYGLESDKSILRRGGRAWFNSSAEENNILLIGLLYIEMPWADDFGCYDLGRAILKRSVTETKQLVERDPRRVDDTTEFGHTVIHLAVGWPEGLELLLDLGGKALINKGDGRGGSPLAYACTQHHFDSARILMSNDCRIDADLLFLAICKHDLGNSKILDSILPELIRRRQQLVQFARNHLGKCFTDSLGIPPDAIPDQLAVFKIQEACHNNKIPVPEAIRHSTEGLTKSQLSAVWNSVFCFSESCNPHFLDFLWSAGFRVRPDLLPWTLGFNDGTGENILDQASWFIHHGCDVHGRFAHDTASFMAYGAMGHVHDPFGVDVKADIQSTKKRVETFDKIYFSSYSIDHHCPCSTEGCTAATASLVRQGDVCTIDQYLWAMFAIESTIQFSSEAAESGLLENIAASPEKKQRPNGFPTCRAWDFDIWEGKPCWLCRGRTQRTVWQKERWIPLASKLLRAYLFHFLRLTHSLSCCKAGLDEKGKPNNHRSFVCVNDEDTVRKRQEEERPRVAELETLVQELVKEFKSESMRLTMSRFIEEVAKPRAEKLIERWKDNESKRKPQQSGVVYEIESDDSTDDVYLLAANDASKIRLSS